MPRYYFNFYVDEPSPEVSEAEAKAASSYTIEPDAVPGVPRHLITLVEGLADRVQYPSAEPSEGIASLQRSRFPGVRSDITTPIRKDSSGSSYTRWFFNGDGVLESRIEVVTSQRVERTTTYDAEGRAGMIIERIFNEAGEIVEMTEQLVGSDRKRVTYYD